ncbi:hypothetical protein [Flavobacterium sp.]|jgi:hypothetical protein|uniref:hypothetical protein n=1 Tax=Flavobacterium sp. TaxID=239 RepID=UPI0037C10496
MKNLKLYILLIIFSNLKAFSQEVIIEKQDLYILFSKNDRNKFFKNDSVVIREFEIYYGKFNDAKSIELKMDVNNGLEKIIWVRGATSSSPTIIFYYWSNDVNRNERVKVDLKNLKNLLEEDEIIKYVEFNNLKEILNKFNLYAVQKEGEEYFACKVQYGIQ